MQELYMTMLADSTARTPKAQVHSGAVILNLGCGTKTSEHCVNVDYSMYMILRQNAWALPLVGPIIGTDRVERIKAMRGTMVRQNLKSGLPFATGFADAAYHSHVMEHIPRDAVVGFQKEILRVLKPGGIQRLCLPDLEQLVREYARSLDDDDATNDASHRHDDRVAAMFEQCVRDVPGGAKGRGDLRVFAEKLLLGDARARGETHRWMWDRVNIRAVLSEAGFTDITVRSWDQSAIPGWAGFALERSSDGQEYKPMSLYVECRKP
jgi:SAM-dependent methyltransferase